MRGVRASLTRSPISCSMSFLQAGCVAGQRACPEGTWCLTPPATGLRRRGVRKTTLSGFQPGGRRSSSLKGSGTLSAERLLSQNQRSEPPPIISASSPQLRAQASQQGPGQFSRVLSKEPEGGSHEPTHSQHLQLTLQLAHCSKDVKVTVVTLILERKALSSTAPLLMLIGLLV